MATFVSTIFTWWLVLQLFGLVGLPLATWLFGPLPDRGYSFSKSLGLLLTGYGAWLIAMFGLGSFGLPLVLLALLLPGGGGLLLAYTRVGRPGLAAVPGLLRAYLRRHWRGILAYELLFLAALVGLAWVRSHALGFVGPDPWGTERPMDFAFFNAIRYSASFPPADPWLAGYSINYYYFGYLLMAIVALLSGLQPGPAYNMALASIFALTALGVAGIITNLTGLTLQRWQAQHAGAAPATTADPPNWPPRWPGLAGILVRGRWLAALLGVVLVLLIGNQAGALQVIVGDYRVVALDGRQLIAAVGQALGGAETIELPYPARTAEGEFGTLTVLERGDTLEDFNWWWPSRTLWDAYDEAGGRVRRYTITEFPFFSFWLGDMHPHVMALPFNLLVLALALATLARPTLPHFTADRPGWLALLLTGIILGSLYIINSWDLPTYLLLYAGALTLLWVRRARGLSSVAWGALAKQIALVGLAAFVLYLPFYLTFRSLVGFAAPLIDLPVIGRLSQILAPFVTDKSGLHSFLIIFGLFLLPLLALACLNERTTRPAPAAAPDSSNDPPAASDAPDAPSTANPPDRPDAPDTPEPTPGGSSRILVGQGAGQTGAQAVMLLEERATPNPAPLQRIIAEVLVSPWLPALLLVGGLIVGFPLLGLAGLGLVAVTQAVRRAAAPAQSFALLVLALGCAICFGTELIYVRDVFNSRMNTIFKFYYQVWLLWGTVSAFALWWLLAEAHLPGASPAGAWRRRGLVYSVGALALLLLVGGLVYPALNLRDVAQDGDWRGLAGRTPLERAPAGAAATRWLRENTPPGSVVLEMVAPGGGSYNGEGYAGVSASTGRPTVLGWFGHQIQWRGGDEAAHAELEPRQQAVDQIYGTTDLAQARELLARYNVRYVYIGSLERRAYAAESLAKFAELSGEAPVFAQDDVVIYRIPAADR